MASLNITPRREGPTYSKEYLQELKASTPSAVARPKPEDQDVSMADLDTTYDVEGALIIDSADTSGAHRSFHVSCASSNNLGNSETLIPSESSVKAAKEKRERLRTGKASGEEDFISLTVSKTEDFDAGPHPGSRLVREEDEIGDGEEGSIPLFSKSEQNLTCCERRNGRVHRRK